MLTYGLKRKHLLMFYDVWIDVYNTIQIFSISQWSRFSQFLPSAPSESHVFMVMRWSQDLGKITPRDETIGKSSRIPGVRSTSS